MILSPKIFFVDQKSYWLEKFCLVLKRQSHFRQGADLAYTKGTMVDELPYLKIHAWCKWICIWFTTKYRSKLCSFGHYSYVGVMAKYPKGKTVKYRSKICSFGHYSYVGVMARWTNFTFRFWSVGVMGRLPYYHVVNENEGCSPILWHEFLSMFVTYPALNRILPS